ncbi:MAG: hypothetical protein J6V53_03185 [Alphaproteobacteria bacterium]|nr:hypothetical protein [Alphaproteobacteria bacterium]
MLSPSDQKQYQIMSNDDVKDMYKKTLQDAQDKAELFYAIHKNKINQPHNKEKTIFLLKKVIIYSAQYNLSEIEYLFKIIHAKNETEANQILVDLKNQVIETYKNFSALEEIGKIRRTLYGIEFPKIFNGRPRIYLKTKPILSETELMQDIVDYLNYPLLRTEKFSYSIETKKLEEDGNFNQKEKTIKRIWLKQKQEMKPVAKLRQYELECSNFLNLLQNNEEFMNRFFRFITKIPNSPKLARHFSAFKKRKDFPPFKLDPIFLRHLKSYPLKNTNHLIAALQNIIQKLSSFRSELHEMLVKPLSDPENEVGIDTIILSTLPRDISSMSTFVHWESCMTNGGLYFQDVMMQIGTGSIIAYGVNSQNPQKKLARILLKPFETAKTLRQRINYMENIDIEFNFPEVQLNKNLLCDYEDMNLKKKELLEEETAYLDENDLELNSQHVERIYKIDKTYGLQNAGFKEILESFINDHLNTGNTPGTYMVVDSMYLDSLQQSYQIYDKYDKDNLIKYLIYNKIPYNFDSTGVIHTSHLNLCHVPNIHLRPLNLKTLTLNGHALHQDVKDITVDRLFIEQADTFKSKTFPKSVQIKNSIFFENTKKQFDMPFGLKAPSVHACDTKLTNIAPDLQTEELHISGTPITALPNIKLKTLDISECKKIKKLPEYIVISQKLNASKSNIQSIPPLSTMVINLNETPYLNYLPNGIKFSHLTAIHSNLSSLPNNLNGISLNCSFSRICEIPQGTKFQEITLDSTPLSVIPSQIQVKALSINNTPVSTLPEGLRLYKLSAENCKNLTKLPQTITIEGFLNLSGSSIQQLPPLKTQHIHLTRCKKIEYLSESTEFQNLFAAQSSLKQLPSNVTANIILCPQSQLTSIPSGLKANSLDARYTPLEEIGDNVCIDTLNVSNTPIKNINPSLNVQCLEAINCKNLTTLTLPNHKIQKINLMASAIHTIHNINTQTLNITNCSHLTQLNDTVVFNNLFAEKSGITTLPDNFCAQEVNISHCPIKKLPENITLYKLTAENTNLHSLPSTLCVHDLNLNNTKITVIPENIQASRILLEDTTVHTLYYSPHFEEIIVNKPIKFIHPCIPNNIITGMTISQIKQAKHNFKQKQKSQQRNNQSKQSERE